MAPGQPGKRATSKPWVRSTTVSAQKDTVESRLLRTTRQSGKEYAFAARHSSRRPVEFWFQESDEGQILFVVYFTLGCRWSRCIGCNLPSKSSPHHIDFAALMAQIDFLFEQPAVRRRRRHLRKVIVSNNGSVLDEDTFSSTALMYLIAKLNLELPNVSILTLETRVEFVDEPELEFLARALKEGNIQTELELAIGFEAFDDQIRNRAFDKGLTLAGFECLCRLVAKFGYHLKCYFMQKPVPDLSDEKAIEDIRQAIDYLAGQARAHRIPINMHLNPTYVATGTRLQQQFDLGRYTPPFLRDVAEAALHAEGKSISLFIGLSDEDLACPGGSFLRRGEKRRIAAIEEFNRTQDFEHLRIASRD